MPALRLIAVPNVLVVHPSIGVNDLKGLIAYAKANAGKLNYASTGIGTSSHLSSFMLASRAGFEAAHIPYKGAEALKDLLTGRIQFMFATIPSVIAHIRAGGLTAIAVSRVKRSRSMPEVPTIAEKAVEQRMIEEGADPAGGSPEKFGAFVRGEHKKWRVVVRDSGASVN